MTDIDPVECHWDILWRGKSVGTEKVGKSWVNKIKGNINARFIRCWTNVRWMNTKYDFIDHVTDAYTRRPINHFIKIF